MADPVEPRVLLGISTADGHLFSDSATGDASMVSTRSNQRLLFGSRKDGPSELRVSSASGVSVHRRLGVGTDFPAVSVDIVATDALGLPVGSNLQRPASSNVRAGMIRFNAELQSFEGYGAGGAWQSLGGVVDINKDTYVIAELAPGCNDDTLRFYAADRQKMNIDSNAVNVFGFLTLQDSVASNDIASSTFETVGTTLWYLGPSNDLYYASGRVGVGTSIARAAFDIFSTEALALPAGTTGQRPADPIPGLLRYNTDSHALEIYASNAWSPFEKRSEETSNYVYSNLRLRLEDASNYAYIDLASRIENTSNQAFGSISNLEVSLSDTSNHAFAALSNLEVSLSETSNSAFAAISNLDISLSETSNYAFASISNLDVSLSQTSNHAFASISNLDVSLSQTSNHAFASISNLDVSLSETSNYAFVSLSNLDVSLSDTSNYAFAALSNLDVSLSETSNYAFAAISNLDVSLSQTSNSAFAALSNLDVSLSQTSNYAFAALSNLDVSLSQTSNYAFSNLTIRLAGTSNALQGKLDLAGGTMTGSIAFSNSMAYGAPTATATGGNGARLTLWPGSGSDTPFGIGFDSNTLWYVVPSNQYNVWYTGVSPQMQLQNGNLTVKGDLAAFANLSDSNLKTDVANLASSLDLVNALRPVTFRWKDDIHHEAKRGSADVGFLAQELEALVPLAVDTAEMRDAGPPVKIVKHERLLPYLVKSIQELSEAVRRLQVDAYKRRRPSI